MNKYILILILIPTMCFADNSITLPDGTKAIILQEYSNSYMLTKEGEHKPFFVEKSNITNSTVTTTTAVAQATNTVTKGNWEITTIDPSANKNQFAKPSVAMLKDNPQIAYFSEQGLSFASFDGNKWTTELVDTTKEAKFEGGGRPTDRISLVFDTRGTPHIAYSQHTKVMYATKTNKGWEIQEIYKGTYPIDELHLNLKSGEIYTIYYTIEKNPIYQSKPKYLKSTWDGTTWVNTIMNTESTHSEPVQPQLNYKIEKTNLAPLLQFNYADKTEDLETVEPTTAELTSNDLGKRYITYVAWAKDISDPKNGQGLKCATSAADATPTPVIKQKNQGEL